MIGFRLFATGGVLPLEFTWWAGRTLQTAMLPTTPSVNGAESYRAAARLGFA